MSILYHIFASSPSTLISVSVWQVNFFRCWALSVSDFRRRIAYPDGHTESEDDEDAQIAYLKAKVDAGADYIVTQLFYDVDGFLRWKKKVRQHGAFWNVVRT